MSEADTVEYTGYLKGHRGWITALACPAATDSKIQVVSASRDKTLVSWVKATDRHSAEDTLAYPERRLEGHGDFVQDIALTSNAEYALSASWDRSLRLWNMKSGACFGKFLGHENDVLSVTFSPDNRHVISGGRDRMLKLWNVRGECVYTLNKDMHQDWVSNVRISPVPTIPLVVSGSWDQTVKVWSLADFGCKSTLRGHTGYVSTVAISPDGSLCASAGKDGRAMLWDLAHGVILFELQCEEPVMEIAFSPNRYWLTAATESEIKIFDLESKNVVAQLMTEESPKGGTPSCLSIAWSADGGTLYSGYDDQLIRVWNVRNE